MPRKTIIFISGPMSGIEDYNHQVFFEAEKKLKVAHPDWGILNPARLPVDLNPENYMPIDLAMVREADILVVLPGWEAASGCNVEVGFAKKLGKTVMSLEEAMMFGGK